LCFAGLFVAACRTVSVLLVESKWSGATSNCPIALTLSKRTASEMDRINVQLIGLNMAFLLADRR